MINKRINRNLWLIWLITILNGLIFYAPIFILYLHQQLVNYTEVTLIIALQAIFIIIFEVPSGAFSDLFGRKKSMIIAAIIHMLSIFFLYTANNFLLLILFAFSSALVQSLNSGTIEAIMYDSSKIDNQADDPKNITFKQAIAVNGALWPISASIASLVGGFLTIYGYKLTILITFIPIIVKLILVFFIKETKHEKKKSVTLLKQISESMKVIGKDNQLILLLFSGFLVYSFAEVAFQIRPVYLQNIKFPIYYIGIILTLSFTFSFLGSLLAERISRRISYKNLLIICQVLMGMLFFVPSFIPIAFINASIMSLESFFWGLRWPIQIDWINSRIDSRERATINSTSNLMSQLGLTIFIMISGYSLDFFGVVWLIRMVGILQILTVVFLLRLEKNKDSTNNK